MFSNNNAMFDYKVSHKTLMRPQVLRAILTDSGIKENSKVLEVGCSNESYQNLLKVSTGCSCWRIELTGGILQTSRTIGTLNGRTGLLSYPNDFFDTVYSFDLICYTSNFREYLEKVYRVLRPGGKLYTIVDLDSVIYNLKPAKIELPENIEINQTRYHRLVSVWKMMVKTGFKTLNEKTIECFASGLQDNQKETLLPIQSFSPNRRLKDEKKISAGDLSAETTEHSSRYLLLYGTK